MAEQRPRSPAAIRLGGLLAFEVGLVVALHQLGRYPFMRVRWDDLGRWLRDTPAEDALVATVRTLALVLAWWMLASTLAYMVAGLAEARRVVRSLRWVMLPGVRRALDGVLALSITGHGLSAAVAAVPPTGSSLVAAVHPEHASAQRSVTPPEDAGLQLAIYHATAPLPAASAGARTYEVKPGDSLYEIAASQLGSGDRWTEIWGLNEARLAAARGGPGGLQIGWQLELPAETRVGSDGEPAPEDSDATSTVVVQPGDSLWSIAENQLRIAWGRDPGDIEVGRYWQQVVDANGARLRSHDPDIVFPGETVLVPSPPRPNGGPVTSSPSTPTPSAPTRPGASEPQPPDGAQTAPGTTAPTSSPHESPAPGDTAPSTTARGAAPEGTTTSASPPDGGDQPSRDPAADDRDSDRSPDAPLAGIAGATVLATGLLLALQRLRRRRMARTARTRWRPDTPGRAGAEVALTVAADVPLTRWAGQELAMLLARLDRRDLAGAAPVAVELSEDRGIELLWDQRAPDAPEPWITADGGWAWRLDHDPEAPVPPDELPAAIPGLVTVGQRDGRQLLIDLEAFGVVTVTGDETKVEDFMRAIGLELATGEDLSHAIIRTVDLDIPAAEHVTDLLTAEPASAALSWLRATVDMVETVLDESGTAFELRTGSSGHLETTVVLARVQDEATAAEFVAASPPRRGVAAVLVGTPAVGGGHVVVAPDGTARLDPYGIVFRAAGVPESTADQVADLLEGEAEPSAEAPAAGGSNGQGPDLDGADVIQYPAREPARGAGAHRPAADEPESSPGMEDEAADGPFDPERHLLVRVLGLPEVPDRPDLGRKELALTVYLACEGGPARASAVQDAVWGGKRVQGKTFWNLVARTRTALGSFDDGEPVMPPTDRVRSMLRLSDRVLSDLALLHRLYDRSLDAPSTEAIDLLQQGLALVQGEPFAGAGYEWAHHDKQYVAEASILIEGAAERLVDLATEAGQPDIARDAILQGLRALPGNEVLYRARMRLEHDEGNLAAVHAAWQELVDKLNDLGTEPSETTAHLYGRLVHGSNR